MIANVETKCVNTAGAQPELTAKSNIHTIYHPADVTYRPCKKHVLGKPKRKESMTLPVGGAAAAATTTRSTGAIRS